MNATFEPFPDRDVGGEPVAVVPYGGAFFAIPARDYRVQIAEGEGGELEMSLLLPEKQGVLVFGRLSGAEPMRNVFALVGDETRTPELESYTRELFGKFPHQFDLVELGFRVGGSIRCDGDLRVAVRDAIALILKATGPVQRRPHAYRNVGVARSILSVGESPQGARMLEYDYEVGGRYHIVTGFLKDARYHETLTALFARASTSAPAMKDVRPLAPLEGKLVAFVGEPTVEKARALALEARRLPGRERVADWLDAYARRSK
jgi:hypothetical protein